MRHHAHPALALAMTGSVLFWSCTSYKRIEPNRISAEDDVRVTMIDGRQVELTDVRVISDTLQGVREDGEDESFPVDDVELLEAKGLDGWKTGGLVLGVGAALLGAAFLTFIIVCDEGTFGPDC